MGENKNVTEVKVDRRSFLKYTGAVGAALAMSNFVTSKKARAVDIQRKDMPGKVHILSGLPGKTMTHGYWDKDEPAVMTMKSGETVVVETRNHLQGYVMPGCTLAMWAERYGEVLEENKDISFYPDEFTGAKKVVRKCGHHCLTGPIYIEEARPGDFLQIEILDIEPNAYAFNLNPNTDFLKLGVLADDFPGGKMRHFYVNRKTMSFEFMPDIEVPIKPFPGTIGVELPDKGRWSNVPPGKHGGNMDNADICTGTVLYQPVWIKGAGMKTGDSHIAQGHGEVNLNALEGSFRNITLRITVRKDLDKLLPKWPFVSTPTHWMAMGMHTDLYKSCQMAVRHAIDFLNKYYGIPAEDAYAFVSMACNLHVTQLVDYTKGIHCMIPKAVFKGQYKEKNTLLLPRQS